MRRLHNAPELAYLLPRRWKQALQRHTTNNGIYRRVRCTQLCGVAAQLPANLVTKLPLASETTHIDNPGDLTRSAYTSLTQARQEPRSHSPGSMPDTSTRRTVPSPRRRRAATTASFSTGFKLRTQAAHYHHALSQATPTGHLHVEYTRRPPERSSRKPRSAIASCNTCNATARATAQRQSDLKRMEAIAGAHVPTLPYNSVLAQRSITAADVPH